LNEPLTYILVFYLHIKHNVLLTLMTTFMKPFLKHNSTWKSKSRLNVSVVLGYKKCRYLNK